MTQLEAAIIEIYETINPEGQTALLDLAQALLREQEGRADVQDQAPGQHQKMV